MSNNTLKGSELLRDLLSEFIGTDKDPRLEHTTASECFISSRSQARI